MRATDFRSRVVFRGRRNYAAWISFFPGEKGQWYISCEELWESGRELPRMSRQQIYESSMPMHFDESPLERELVLLESRDGLESWNVISRQRCRLRHSAGSFAQARTKDRRFLRFGWAAQWLDPDRPNGKIAFVSSDNGASWQEEPEFHDPRLVSYAHRLRTLRDGTLVLAIPFAHAWGKGTCFPVRASTDLNAEHEIRMTLCFSGDEGRTWTAPLPIYAGYSVTETDFVELESGDLLCFNSWYRPGRQIILRSKHGWVPSFYERCRQEELSDVPETICMTPDGLLVGCRRAGSYHWSDDLGITWNRMEGIPERGPEVYQPWIHCLPDGRIACAGHYGADNFFGELDQYVNLHTFRVEAGRKTRRTRIDLERDYDERSRRWRNAYAFMLRCDEEPLAGRELEVWYVERWKPGYEEGKRLPLEERMRIGGRSIRVRTDARGVAHVAMPELDGITNIHHSIQIVARFNADRSDPRYLPAQTAQCELYSLAGHASA